MSWIQKLLETYDRCAGRPQFALAPLMPVDHAEQQVHIEIVLNGEGAFRGASVLAKETTFIQATENSAGRTSAPVAHGLADKLEYIAPPDPTQAAKPKKIAKPGKADAEADSSHTLYLNQLRRWVELEPEPHVQAVLRYVESGTILGDLLREKVLHADPDGRLLTQWDGPGAPPELFKFLTATAGERNQRAAVVRWVVQREHLDGAEVEEAQLWKNLNVQASWQRFVASQAKEAQLCMVTGEMAPTASNHPKRIRHAADGAKLVSSNDSQGYTFRGRFDAPEQAYSLGSATTQKAHNALRWLIARQGYKNGEQAIVAWAVRGGAIPSIIAGSNDLLDSAKSDQGGIPPPRPERYRGDAGQLFAEQVKSMIRGYRAELEDREDIVVLALDSATPGRMAMTYYRELQASEFLERIRAWHEDTAWPQNMGKERQFVGAPAPRDIAEVAYGRRIDDKLKKAVVERLLPCIVDGRPIPRDLITACVQQASNPAGKEHWEWERCLGVACSLVRGSRKERNYSMSLEESRHTRDYLFGRLLAIAERIEGYALFLAKESRNTTAERLMQRFADHPATTWRTIELALQPYMQRLQSSRPGALFALKRLLDEVLSHFEGDDFIRIGRLDAEFLLGYHCQRAAFRKDDPVKPEENVGDSAQPAA